MRICVLVTLAVLSVATVAVDEKKDCERAAKGEPKKYCELKADWKNRPLKWFAKRLTLW